MEKEVLNRLGVAGCNVRAVGCEWEIERGVGNYSGCLYNRPWNRGLAPFPDWERRAGGADAG